MQTKGPWEYSLFEEYPEERGGYFIFAPGIKPCIAKLNTSGDYGDYDPNKSEAHDNARLIAAAPDLLDTCKSALATIGQVLGDSSGVKEDQLIGLHGQLRKAVAKATGITTIRSIKTTSI